MPQNIGYLTADKTTAGDERFTPYYAVEPLLEFLPPADTGITIWCPFDEFWSAYVQTFRANGYNVVYGSLATGQDFFTSQPAHWDIMISNPPFSKKRCRSQTCLSTRQTVRPSASCKQHSRQVSL